MVCRIMKPFIECVLIFLTIFLTVFFLFFFCTFFYLSLSLPLYYSGLGEHNSKLFSFRICHTVTVSCGLLLLLLLLFFVRVTVRDSFSKITCSAHTYMCVVKK